MHNTSSFQLFFFASEMMSQNQANIASFYDIVSRELRIEQITNYTELPIHLPESLCNAQHLTHINTESKNIYLALFDVQKYENEDDEEELYNAISSMNRRCAKKQWKFHLVVPNINSTLSELRDEINIDIIIVDVNKTSSTSFESYKYKIDHIPENAQLSDYFYELVGYYFNAKKYADLTFKEMEQLNNDLDYINAREEEDLDWLDKPFITHADLKNKILYKAFVISDDVKVTGKSSLFGMNKICSNHGYKYYVIMSNHCERLEEWCREANITYYVKRPEIIKQEADKEVLVQNEEHKKFALREYQQDCLRYMNSIDKVGVCRLPCGMGKSIIMISYIMQHKNNTLILVPNISLVTQFKNKIEEYCENFTIGTPEIICLSSKDSGVLTKKTGNQKIVICVYNSFVKRIVMHKNYFKGFDMFVDEAHHIIHPTKCKREISSVEETIHRMIIKSNDDDTEDSEDSTDDSEDDEVKFIESLNGNDTKKMDFSQIIFNYAVSYCNKMFYFSATINEAGFSVDMIKGVDEKCLCKLNIRIVHARTSEYPLSKNGNEKYDRYKKMREYSWCTKNMLCKESALVHYIKQKRYEAGKSIIIYCGTCNEASYLYRSISANISNFKAVVIKANTPKLKREKWFSDFRNGKIRCIITVNCISEGVDLPEADEAIFFVDKKSIINIIQSTGRVLRVCKGKQSAALTIFSTKDTDNEGIFKNIISTLNGEFGYYGSINLRYAVTNEFLDTQDHKFKEDEKKIITTCYYKENERLWRTTNVQERLMRIKRLLMMGEDVNALQNEDLNKFVKAHKEWNDSVWKIIEQMVDECKNKDGNVSDKHDESVICADSDNEVKCSNKFIDAANYIADDSDDDAK